MLPPAAAAVGGVNGKQEEHMLGLGMRRCLVAVAAGVVIAGCGSDDNGGSSGDSGSKPNATAIAASKSLAALDTKVLSKGPNGESPEPAKDVTLTAEELAKVKAMHATAAIVMHYAGNDWSTAQIAGLKNEFGQLGMKVIAVTDANFKPDKQVSDIETVLARKPNVIVSIPTDPVATAGAYRKGANQGVKLVFRDNGPRGFKPGSDYVRLVSADNYGNGVAAAALMGEKLG